MSHVPQQVHATTRAEVEAIVRQTIVSTLMLEEVSPDSLEREQLNFMTALGANSIDALEVIIAVEDRLGIEFDDHDLKPELLDTLDGFVSAVCVKLKIDSGVAQA